MTPYRRAHLARRIGEVVGRLRISPGLTQRERDLARAAVAALEDLSAELETNNKEAHRGTHR